MDLPSATTPPTKSPDSDTDTETPLQTHLTKALSLTNGSLNPCHQHPPQPQPQQQQMVLMSYKECLKNHAATLGGLALDGCGEFMPTPCSTPLHPTSLKCAACGCHRNFHRREPAAASAHLPQLHWTSSASPGPSSSPSSPASPTPQQSFYPSAPHILLALSTGHSGPMDENHSHHHHRNPTSFSPTVMNPHGKKRARTKFTEEQKEKMYAFAEKLGWKMLRGSADRIVEDFCNEVGVKRNVFKVWMHNNKNRREKGNSFDINTTNNNIGSDIAHGKEGIRGDFDTTIDYSNNVSSCNYDDSFDRYRIESKDHGHGSTDDGSPSSQS